MLGSKDFDRTLNDYLMSFFTSLTHGREGQARYGFLLSGQPSLLYPEQDKRNRRDALKTYPDPAATSDHARETLLCHRRFIPGQTTTPSSVSENRGRPSNLVCSIVQKGFPVKSSTATLSGRPGYLLQTEPPSLVQEQKVESKESHQTTLS